MWFFNFAVVMMVVVVVAVRVATAAEVVAVAVAAAAVALWRIDIDKVFWTSSGVSEACRLSRENYEAPIHCYSGTCWLS